jgi:hypothetical protein
MTSAMGYSLSRRIYTLSFDGNKMSAKYNFPPAEGVVTRK